MFGHSSAASISHSEKNACNGFLSVSMRLEWSAHATTEPQT